MLTQPLHPRSLHAANPEQVWTSRHIWSAAVGRACYASNGSWTSIQINQGGKDETPGLNGIGLNSHRHVSLELSGKF